MIRGIIGIYCIVNNYNMKKYIGQSVDVEYRICNHFSKLRHNRHENEHMQRAYNKNPNMFSWVLLKQCKIDELDAEEIKLISKYKTADPSYGYNKQYGGQILHKATPETREKMSIAKLGKKFTKEHRMRIGQANHRRKLSPETKAKISIARSKKVSQYDKKGNKIQTYRSIKIATEKMGLKSESSIRNVLYGIAPTAKGYIWKYE